MATTTDQLGGYITTPTPQYGSGAYGAVPGAVGIPPSIYSQIGTIDPNLADQTGTANTTILNELQGQLSPETIASIQQHAGQFGASSGMPGSQFAGNYGQMQLGQSVEKQQQQGLSDYLKMLQGTGATLTPQQLAAQIASSNATLASAPNPTAAANQQMTDWQTKFNAAAGGGAGGVRAPNPAGGGGSPMAGSTGAFAGGGAATAYDPYATGQSFAGDISNPNSAWWNDPSGNTSGYQPTSSGYLNDPSLNTTQPASTSDPYYNSGAGVQNWGSLYDPNAVTNTDPFASLYTDPSAGIATDPMAGNISDPTSAWWNP
jgi:hypothetical protein